MARHGAIGVLLLGMSLLACSGDEADVETVPDPSDVDPTAQLSAAAASAGASESWTHVVSMTVDGMGPIAATTHRRGSLGRMSVQMGGSVLEVWSEGAETLMTVDDSPVYSYPQPSERLIIETLDPVVLLEGLVSMDVTDTGVDETGSRISVACDDRAVLPPGFLLAQACGPESGTTISATISATTGLMTEWTIDGQMEIWPGEWSDASGGGIFEPLRSDIDFTAPTDADDTGAACLAAALGLAPDDAVGLTSALNVTSTEENQELYQGCGFPVWPTGADLNS